MKKALITLVLLAIAPAVVSAQTPSRQGLSSEQSKPKDSNTVRSRVVGPKASNHAESQKTRPSADGGSIQRSSPFTWGNTAIPEQTPRVFAASNNSSSASNKSAVAAVAEPSAPKLVQPTVLAAKRTGESVIVPVATSPRSPVTPSMYIVGVGDVLDIRLPNTTPRESTLFTVLKNGVIEYPLLNGPLVVAGLTTDQISSALAAQIIVIKTPKVNVSVRDYASHSVLVSGLVDNAGRKVLRRESMPLYALLAEASVRPDANSVTIIHNGKEGTPLSLKDETTMATLIFSGDAIRISGGDAAPNAFVYVGGDVSAPGEKIFRQGMTLTQVLLSAGADLSTKKVAKVARRNPNGLLSTSEYDVKAIAQGKKPDPQIIPGDRIEVR